jgi:hypothetical protein
MCRGCTVAARGNLRRRPPVADVTEETLAEPNLRGVERSVVSENGMHLILARTILRKR